MSRAGTAGGEDPAGERGAAERAAWLLRWYPRAWRDRYGDEFTELLIADIRERPRSVVRTLDVARGGVVARLADAGLAGFPAHAAGAADPYRQVRASLGSLGCVLAVFLAFAAAMWSQLMIGWQWSSSASAAATPRAAGFAAILTSATLLALLVLVLLATVPVVIVVARGLRVPQAATAVPAAVALAAGVILFFGGRHFGNGWPGTGGQGGFLPAGLEAFAWAVSLSVSAYWAHPGAMAAFPVAELTWMAVSPLLLAVFAAAAVILLRRAGLPSRLLAFEARLAIAACTVMAVFLAAAGYWVAAGGQRPLFHAGLIDVAGVAVLAVALAVAARAARMASRGLRLARG